MIADLIELVVELFIPAFRKKKKREEEWYGVVEDKLIKSDFSVAKYNCVVVFRRDDGSKRKFKVSEADFHSLEKSKRYYKQAGEKLPAPAPKDSVSYSAHLSEE